MLEFPGTAQQYPATQAARERIKNFREVYAGFSPAQAASQASRCSQCGIPFCQIHCPLQNNIPDWLKLAAEGRLQEAYEISSATNNFPEICGRICPQDKLCEGNCVIEKGFGAVTIGAVEKYITEQAFAEGWVQPIHSASETVCRVGIIGAGPAGLAAADMLRREGHAVVVYDRHDRAGGLLAYGIPNFKLEKHVVERRVALLEGGGVQFRLNHEVKDLRGLREKHDAVLIATGVYKAKKLEGSAPGIIPALDYLFAGNRQGYGVALPQGLDAVGKSVVVIGGGDTAMDCVRTAVRQGAKSVTCLYRRDRANMPGSAKEVKNAEEEGVVFHWLAAPAGVTRNEVVVQPMRLLPADKSGRRGVAPAKGAPQRLRADMVIAALGFDAEDLPGLWGEPGLKVSASGTIAADAALMTSIPGVFAAGDIVRGASLVVWAIKDGRDAAAGISRYLQGRAAQAA